MPDELKARTGKHVTFKKARELRDLFQSCAIEVRSTGCKKYVTF
jgi:hypothetical protein